MPCFLSRKVDKNAADEEILLCLPVCLLPEQRRELLIQIRKCRPLAHHLPFILRKHVQDPAAEIRPDLIPAAELPRIPMRSQLSLKPDQHGDTSCPAARQVVYFPEFQTAPGRLQIPVCLRLCEPEVFRHNRRHDPVPDKLQESLRHPPIHCQQDPVLLRHGPDKSPESPGRIRIPVSLRLSDQIPVDAVLFSPVHGAAVLDLIHRTEDCVHFGMLLQQGPHRRFLSRSRHTAQADGKVFLEHGFYTDCFIDDHLSEVHTFLEQVLHPLPSHR